MQSMKDRIAFVCDEIKELLFKKNESYGNSAANPVGIFSKTTPIEQINIRIDDKLNRIARGKEYAGDDTELDLIGYLILKRAIKGLSTIKAPKGHPLQCPYDHNVSCHMGEPCVSCDTFDAYRIKQRNE